MTRHERFRERLAGFEACGIGGRAKQQAARRLKNIAKADAQRLLGSDDGEIDLFAVGEGENGVRVRDIAGNRSGDPCNAGISGRAHQFADVPVSGEAGD